MMISCSCFFWIPIFHHFLRSVNAARHLFLLVAQQLEHSFLLRTMRRTSRGDLGGWWYWQLCHNHRGGEWWERGRGGKKGGEEKEEKWRIWEGKRLMTPWISQSATPLILCCQISSCSEIWQRVGNLLLHRSSFISVREIIVKWVICSGEGLEWWKGNTETIWRM